MKLLVTCNLPKAVYLPVLLFLIFLYSCEHLEKIGQGPPKANQESAQVVYEWYKLMGRIQLRTSPAPNTIFNNRSFGCIGVGLYEAVRPGIKDAVSLSARLYQMPAMPEPEKHQEYMWGASANAALASMFRQLLVGLTDADKARIDSMENAWNEQFGVKTSLEVITRSQAFGRSVANAVYDWSATDNFNLSAEGYNVPVFPGAWVPTPPAFAKPVGPFLKDSRPFLESSLTTATPPLPFAYAEEPTSEFYKAAKEVYDISKTLTAEQKAIANWWADVGGVGAGLPHPYHSLSIVTGILESKHIKLGQAAEIYARTGIALKDAFVINWRGKYQYSLLRPVTYINQHIDPDWKSYIPTPPYPEYPSGLAGVYTPVMQVLIRTFGDIPVTDNAYGFRGADPRKFASISELVNEAADSRIYAGFHYRFTQDATRKMGKELGDKIANLDLKVPKQ